MKKENRTKLKFIADQVTTVDSGEQSLTAPLKRYSTAFRILIIIALSVFVAELIVMFLIFALPPFSTVVEAFIDAFLLIVFIFPILYIFLFRPLILHIKERERAEEALQAKTKEMETLLRAVSHDLRTPLANIDGYSGELASDCEHLTEMLEHVTADEETKKLIETLAGEQIPESLSFIHKGTMKMESLLKGLSHLAKIGTVKLDIQRLDINDIAQQVVDVMKFSAREAGAAIELETLPDCHGDEVQINQIFSNLIGNAIKYLDPERAGRIRIWGKVEGNMSQYCVEDNGVGIPDHHKPKVFEIFHRVDPTSSVSGEGLGLTTVKQIVERHKGRIWLESEEGKGSKFFVVIPT